ncbi:MAG: GPR endopeptidase [Clostridia bacterium]|nr:GPR endopeptidase [Clostridia bacterium]MBQ9598400.1 GPR endopeptidase [Clostridia bacterium]MBR0027652.1 GPR endopeptidase [Clostridia bacterium]MBR0470501.1 GPR endopeptidase [Clostridia bacterium]
MISVRTDLAVEAHEISKREAKEATEINGVISRVEEMGRITVTRVEITNENGERALGKAQGNYITIDAPDLKYSVEIYERVCTIIANEIHKMADLSPNSVILVAGLGNRDITPDALGTCVVSKLLVTRHLKSSMSNIFGDNLGDVCAIAPGVSGTTGIETADIIKSVTERVKPDLIIAVDALAAADIERISNTIQISDTGIQPGAGVGNNRSGLNEATTGVKVIAIGVPTVIDAATISKNEIPKEMAPLMVTTKDIDLVIERSAKTVANGINLALHSGMTLSELESLVG